jgi:hypothetical protein
MRSVTALAVVLALAAMPAFAAKPTKGAKAAEEEPADPNAAVAKTHGGKVWTHAGAAPSPELLAGWLDSQAPAGTLERKDKEGPWALSYAAVFKKPATKGPMTVQFFEKGDAKNIVDQYSPENGASSLVFQDTYELSPDKGFNKDRSYVIKVGQILKGKFQSYATGELSLK